MVFSGDFYQIPPPRSPSVYYTAEDKASHSIPTASVAKKKTKQSKVSMPHTFGKLLWRECLTDVIELKQNHRQQDLEWATALENFRINQPTQSDIDFVSKRYMFDSDNNLNAPPLTLTAVPDNEMRENVLHYCEQRVIESLPNIANENTNWRERGVLLIKARIEPKKPKKVTNTASVAEPTPPPPPDKISLAKKEYLRKLSSKTLDCTGNLYCIVGF